MKNIIVPFDFSTEAFKGLTVALKFAEIRHTNIQLVYVKKKSNDYNTISAADERKMAEHKFQEIITRFEPMLKNESTLRYIIKKGKIYHEIVAQAESYKDAMICMSTHGASGFEELFIGSNASRIITSTELPVITINNGECPENFKKIIMPIDASQQSRQKVSFTAEIAHIFSAEIYVVGVTSLKDEKTRTKIEVYINQVARYLESLKLPVQQHAMAGEDLADVIIEFAKKENADLISIMSEPGGFSLFSSNHSSEIIRKSPIPVLNITPKTIGKPGSFSTFGG